MAQVGRAVFERARESGPLSDAEILEQARRVLREEGEAVLELVSRLGPSFLEALRLLGDMKGRAVVSGVGKSGIIARKIAATLTSTGTPAFYLHPVEGMHGDVGMMQRDDVLLAVSKSGESEELRDLLGIVKRLGVPIVALTGNADSSLARHADVVLDVHVREEACPFDLAPTSSTTAALAMGDALAVALLLRKGFTKEDFARLHPGGALGRRLNLRVADVMMSAPAEVPALGPDATLREAMIEIAHKRGTVPIVDGERRVIGVITAGDLTRYAERNERFFPVAVREAMNANPRLTTPDSLAAAAVYQMETHGIMALPVVDEEGRLVGIVHLHDLLRAGVA
ncbi:MAG: KpsF/GutQ family sugar-phosphate isomerase [Gemmatimonadetes bacterium]|nr:KpsF/GutQ family sugar-phosphate isomerase [Gemmatimonadota bacterium]